ncbi:hypothetical protein FB451DRAFT_1192382 [Mycena latifolia]|nr:hypothetical protein FB451DRAFT_1192382 [Mycena latifolia]
MLASQYLHKALELSESHADSKVKTDTLYYFGSLGRLVGDYLGAQRHTLASYKLSEASGDLFAQACLEILASCARARGDLRNGLFLCQRAKKLLELSGTTSGHAYNSVMHNQAEIHLAKSEYDQARSLHMKVVEETAADHNSLNYVWGLLNVAQLDIMMGARKQDVLHNLDKAKTLFNAKTYGYYNPMSAKIYCDIEFGKLHLREGETHTAKGILQKCFNSLWGHEAEGILSCMGSLANVSRWPQSDFGWASKWTVTYLGYAQKLENKPAFYQALQFLGDVFQAQGESATSTALLTVALEGFTYMDVHHDRAECMLRLGDLAKGQGDVSKAVELWKLARPLFERSSQAKQVTQIDERLVTITRAVLEEHTGSLAHLVQLNTTGAVAEETRQGTKAGDTKVEGGQKDADQDLFHVLV